MENGESSRQRFEDLPVLIAEDSDDDLLLLQRALQRADVSNPEVALHTGRETIVFLEQALASGNGFPVVLFLDLLMPQVSGLEVLKWLRDHPHPTLTVVLHTGVEDESMLEKARDLGARFLLPKGARPEAIREVFRRARVEWEQYQLVQQ